MEYKQVVLICYAQYTSKMKSTALGQTMIFITWDMSTWLSLCVGMYNCTPPIRELHQCASSIAQGTNGKMRVDTHPNSCYWAFMLGEQHPPVRHFHFSTLWWGCPFCGFSADSILPNKEHKFGASQAQWWVSAGLVVWSGLKVFAQSPPRLGLAGTRIEKQGSIGTMKYCSERVYVWKGIIFPFGTVYDARCCSGKDDSIWMP